MKVGGTSVRLGSVLTAVEGVVGAFGPLRHGGEWGVWKFSVMEKISNSSFEEYSDHLIDARQSNYI